MRKCFLPILLCILLTIPGCASHIADDAPELIEPSGTAAASSPVIRGEFCTTEVYEGFVTPDVTELSFDRDGTIWQISVGSGCYVNEGDLLVKLNTKEEEEKAVELEAELELLRSDYEYTKAVHENRKEYLRTELKQTAEANGTNSAEYQLKQIDLEESDLAYAKSEKDLESSISQKEQTLAAIEQQIALGAITAEHAGYFYLSSDITEDAYVQKGKTICCITKDDSLMFTCSYLDEADLKNCALSALIGGVSYEISYVPLSEEERSALYFTDERDRSLFTFLPDADLSSLSAGNTGFLIVNGHMLDDALQVPINALFADSSGKYVYVMEEGTKKRQDVTVGASNGIMTVIEEGLNEEDIVYVQQ
ncbi:MAG: hypothetical protein MR332_13070 [Fusicatenibacter sp.]|nr:hypothetical protein [Fusicatenibacter sp.]